MHQQKTCLPPELLLQKSHPLSLTIRCNLQVISAFWLNASFFSGISKYEDCLGTRGSGTVVSLQTPNVHNNNALYAL